MTRSLQAAFLLAALVLAATAVRMSGGPPGAAAFIVPTALPLPTSARADYWPQPPTEGVAHAPTAVLLGDGRIALYWFAGTREAAADVVLRRSVFDGTAWSPPVDVTGAAKTGGDERRFVFTVGNPVIFRHPDGEYWLIYVSSVSGWSFSALNLMRSPDGLLWGPARRLVTGPFLNFSTLVRSPPVVRSDGLVALPAYHESIATFPEMILLNPAGDVVDKVRMGGDCPIQPWIVPLGAGRAVALMRPHGCADMKLVTATTADGGDAWSDTETTTFANPDSPAAALRLADGRIVAVLNDHAQNAYQLDLAVSDDEGKTWRKSATPIFDGTADHKDYRYPWLLQDAAGQLNLFVSESKRAIRHVVLGSDAVPAR